MSHVTGLLTACSAWCMLVQVVDVGGGTGFCTLGVVKTIKPENVTLIDQSPHQLEKARQKPGLKGVTIMEVRPDEHAPECINACAVAHVGCLHMGA
jgi:hypothetical protein